MTAKKGNSKKGGFMLAPITLSEPVRQADGFTNLLDPPAETVEREEMVSEQEVPKNTVKRPKLKTEGVRKTNAERGVQPKDRETDRAEKKTEKVETPGEEPGMTESELLRILDADSLDEIYELADVLRASSLKLYATLIGLADSRGRARVKNHELMSKSGIKGIATLYKQERWLMDLKLLEKKAKPGPHDGSLYVVRGLETLPLPDEIYEKFDDYLANLK